MARILYAAGNREGSYEQLKRYLPFFKASKHQFKIAGFKKSFKNLNVDYCLDSLLNFANPLPSVSFNGNFSFYSKEINKFKPDIIISDLELFTSIYAISKNIPLWQASPALLYYGILDIFKRKICVHKFNSAIISEDYVKHQYIKYILNNSDRKIVISHICDVDNRPELLYGYEWCRPEFELKNNNLPIINSNGTEASLADAFYNEQYTIMKFSELDVETITGISCNIYFKLGQLELDFPTKKAVNININNDTKFLMDLINEIPCN